MSWICFVFLIFNVAAYCTFAFQFVVHGTSSQVEISGLSTRESSYCFQRILAIAILSVRLSHGWISQKRCKLGAPNLHRRLPGRL